MKSNINIILLIVISNFINIASYGQDYSEEAKEYFSGYLDTESQMELFTTSLPTLEECKLIFKNENANIFYEYVETLKIEIENEELIEKEYFAVCKVESFSTCDFEKETNYIVGGMYKIKDKFKDKIIFYQVTYLREQDAVYGVNYNYFVNIKGRWVFIPKPWHVLG